jgi:hypothetical protein
MDPTTAPASSVTPRDRLARAGAAFLAERARARDLARRLRAGQTPDAILPLGRTLSSYGLAAYGRLLAAWGKAVRDYGPVARDAVESWWRVEKEDARPDSTQEGLLRLTRYLARVACGLEPSQTLEGDGEDEGVLWQEWRDQGGVRPAPPDRGLDFLDGLCEEGPEPGPGQPPRSWYGDGLPSLFAHVLRTLDRVVGQPDRGGDRRLAFDDHTFTVFLDGTPYLVADPKAYEVYQTIASCAPRTITRAGIQGKVKATRGKKTVRGLIDTLPPPLRDTVKSGSHGYHIVLPPAPPEK